MEIAVLAVLAVVALATVYVVRRDGDLLAKVLARQDSERDAWAQERRTLLNRIQAPEIMRANPVMAEQEEASFGPVDPDDVDESWKVGLVG